MQKNKDPHIWAKMLSCFFFSEMTYKQKMIKKEQRHQTRTKHGTPTHDQQNTFISAVQIQQCKRLINNARNKDAHASEIYLY